MKKLLASALMAAGLMVGSMGVSQAATTAVTGAFNVTVALTSVCTITTPAALAFTYTAFGGATNATGGGFSVTCTNNLPKAVTFTGALGGGTQGATTATGTFTATNLSYILGISGASPGTVTVAGSSTVAAAGTGAAENYFVNGTMAAGQAGTCATATCLGTVTGTTLTVTF